MADIAPQIDFANRLKRPKPGSAAPKPMKRPSPSSIATAPKKSPKPPDAMDLARMSKLITPMIAGLAGGRR